MNEVLSVVLLVGIALTSTIGLGMAALHDVDDTGRAIAEADARAYDTDGDGHADGARVYVHSPSPGTVRLEVLEDGELLGTTTARTWQDGAYLECTTDRRVLDTRAMVDGHQLGAGTVTIQPCHEEDAGDEDEACEYELCEDPPLPDPCEPTATTTCTGWES